MPHHYSITTQLKLTVLVAVIILSLAAVVYMANLANNQPPQLVKFTRQPTIERCRLASWCVVGTVHNISNNNLQHLEVRCQVKISNIKLADVYDRMDRLDAGDVWLFEAYGGLERPSGARAECGVWAARSEG